MEATGDPAASLGRIDRPLTKKGRPNRPFLLLPQITTCNGCEQIALGGSDAHFRMFAGVLHQASPS